MRAGVRDAGRRRYARLVASSTRIGVALLSAAVSLVPMACGGDEAGMRATLTDDGCTYEGDTSPTAGMFTIEVENKTDFSGSFVLLSLAGGSTVDDLQPSVEQYPRQFERDGSPLPEPPDYKFLVRSDVEAGATSALPADVPAGTYAVVCFVDDDLPSKEVFIAEQLDVTE